MRGNLGNVGNLGNLTSNSQQNRLFPGGFKIAALATLATLATRLCGPRLASVAIGRFFVPVEARRLRRPRGTCHAITATGESFVG